MLRGMFPSRGLFGVLSLWAATSAMALASDDSYDQSSVPVEVARADPTRARVVLLAGSPSNKAGQHEYFAGCALFMEWLQQTPGIEPVLARDGWPRNEAILDGAKSVVCFLDGGGKHPFIEPSRLKRLQSLMDAGVGLVVLHQAVDCPRGLAEPVLSWLGAVWQPDIGCRGHWDMEFSNLPDHPTLRGVKSFAAPGDGWLYNLHFAPGMKGVTPLLRGAVPESSRTTVHARQNPGRSEIIAWAFERPAGGRSFGFTGCDLHRNWEVESQRRLVINGILWTAQVPVPDGGAAVRIRPGDLNRFLDDKRPQGVQKAPLPSATPNRPAAP